MPAASPAEPFHWQYRVDERAAGAGPGQDELAAAGAAGWQLAAVVPNGAALQWVFQRPARGPLASARHTRPA